MEVVNPFPSSDMMIPSYVLSARKKLSSLMFMSSGYVPSTFLICLMSLNFMVLRSEIIDPSGKALVLEITGEKCPLVYFKEISLMYSFPL